MASVFGVGVMLLFLPLQIYLGRLGSLLRLKSSALTDERVRLMNEIIAGIQVIKLYVWEIPFQRTIEAKRANELATIRSANFIRGILQSFILFLTKISVFASLLSYVARGEELTARKAFVLTAYYNILRTTMTVYFPMGISQFAETLASIQRIQNYLRQPEVNSQKSSAVGPPRPVASSSCEYAVAISKLKAKWQTNLTDFTLYNIQLNVRPATTVAIIGPVGSGKSRLVYLYDSVSSGVSTPSSRPLCLFLSLTL